MAHGLRMITSSTYMPYGSGRDWFFIGDYTYRNGRRTPDPQTRHLSKIDKPMSLPRGKPREMRGAKQSSASVDLRSPQFSRCDVSSLLGPRHRNEHWSAMSVGPRRAAQAETSNVGPGHRSASSPALRTAYYDTTATDFGAHQVFNRDTLESTCPKYKHFSMPIFFADAEQS
mmetsp:Transcript_11368/g.21557  ORF Transcript_11368/g.21557 Transcript_11368/m.21557 type:complete len:172 (-) Transcript_11368:58-573(-)